MDKHHFALDAVSSLNATTCFSSSETTSLQTNVIFVHVVTSIYINCWHIFLHYWAVFNDMISSKFQKSYTETNLNCLTNRKFPDRINIVSDSLTFENILYKYVF